VAADLSKTQKGSAAIAAALPFAVLLAAQFEGYVPHLYKDAAGIPTYCYGETQLLKHDPSHIYAQTECMALLRERMRRDYAPKVLQCSPVFLKPEWKKAFGATIDASYNAGPVAVCRSPMVRAFNLPVPNKAKGCAAFRGWYVTARNRTTGQRIYLKGLIRRRNAEAQVCAS
jgi:lysozyme